MLEHLYLKERATQKLTTLRREAQTARALRHAQRDGHPPAEPHPAPRVGAPVDPVLLLQDAAPRVE